MEKSKIVGQTKSAGFQVGIRKTFAVPVETAWNFLVSEDGFSTWLGEINLEKLALNKRYKSIGGIESVVNVFKPNSHIRLTWRPKHWANASSLQIRVIPTKSKTTISFHQDKLLDSNQRNEMKKYWDAVLTKIEQKLIN